LAAVKCRFESNTYRTFCEFRCEVLRAFDNALSISSSSATKEIRQAAVLGREQVDAVFDGRPFLHGIYELLEVDSINQYFGSPLLWRNLGIWDYPVLVISPMDLGTVIDRIKNEEYGCHSEVMNDIRLVFLNALRYNPASSAVGTSARKGQRLLAAMCKTPSILAAMAGDDDRIAREKAAVEAIEAAAIGAEAVADAADRAAAAEERRLKRMRTMVECSACAIWVTLPAYVDSGSLPASWTCAIGWDRQRTSQNTDCVSFVRERVLQGRDVPMCEMRDCKKKGKTSTSSRAISIKGLCNRCKTPWDRKTTRDSLEAAKAPAPAAAALAPPPPPAPAPGPAPRLKLELVSECTTAFLKSMIAVGIPKNVTIPVDAAEGHSFRWATHAVHVIAIHDESQVYRLPDAPVRIRRTISHSVGREKPQLLSTDRSKVTKWKVGWWYCMFSAPESLRSGKIAIEYSVESSAPLWSSPEIEPLSFKTNVRVAAAAAATPKSAKKRAATQMGAGAAERLEAGMRGDSRIDGKEPAATDGFPVGAVVSVKVGPTTWRTGCVIKRSSYTFDCSFDDGDFHHGMSGASLFCKGRQCPFRVGTRILAEFSNTEVRFPGTITAVNAVPTTVEVRFSDHEVGREIPLGRVRLESPPSSSSASASGSPPAASSAASTVPLQLGSRVSCVYTTNGKPVRYAGKVDKVFEASSKVTVHWDDGDKSTIPIRLCRREDCPHSRKRKAASAADEKLTAKSRKLADNKRAAAAAEAAAAEAAAGPSVFCALCQDDHPDDEDIIRLPCRHAFCRDMLFAWAASSNAGGTTRRGMGLTCPTCRGRNRLAADA